MKRVICLLLLLFLFVTPLAGCKSEAEKKYDDAKHAAENLKKEADEAQSRYDELKKDISDYQESVSRLDSAR